MLIKRLAPDRYGLAGAACSVMAPMKFSELPHRRVKAGAWAGRSLDRPLRLSYMGVAVAISGMFQNLGAGGSICRSELAERSI